MSPGYKRRLISNFVGRAHGAEEKAMAKERAERYYSECLEQTKSWGCIRDRIYVHRQSADEYGSCAAMTIFYKKEFYLDNYSLTPGENKRYFDAWSLCDLPDGVERAAEGVFDLDGAEAEDESLGRFLVTGSKEEGGVFPAYARRICRKVGKYLVTGADTCTTNYTSF